MIPCVDLGGYRKYGKIYNGRIHVGHDYNCEHRTDVTAIQTGKVIRVAQVNGFGGTAPSRKGWVIMIETKKFKYKITTLYGHVVPTSKIKKGCKVKKGQKIGEVSHYYIEDDDVPHLHMGCWLGGGIPKTDKKNKYGYVEKINNWIDPHKAMEYLI